MIVPMKKVHIVVLADRRLQATEDLKQLGLVHVSEKQVQSSRIEEIRSRQNQYFKALVHLGSVAGKKDPSGPHAPLSGRALLDKVMELGESAKELEEGILKALIEEQRLEPLGSFEPGTLLALAEQGQKLSLWTLPTADMAKLDKNLQWFQCAHSKSRVWLAVLGDTQGLPSTAESFAMPELSLNELRKQTVHHRQKLAEIKNELRLYLPGRDDLESDMANLEAELEQAVVEASMDNAGSLAVLEGFIPADLSGSIKSWASEKGWGLLIDDPSQDDAVPTLLKSPGPVKMLKPILGFLGTTPGYRERDISHWFLFFLVIFFAMIIGDAVYGLIILALGVYLGIKTKKPGKPLPDFVPLLLTFSTATIIWGTITCTWLGLPDDKLPSFLLQLRVPYLAGEIDARNMINPASASLWASDPASLISQKNIQLICFIMGAIHLLLAHFLRFASELKKAPHIHAFAQLGWASVLFGAFFLVLNVVLDPRAYPVPEWAMYFIGGGMGAVFLFEKQEAGVSFIKGVLSALANVITTALSGVSAFADVISYIRLFAVGLAGLAIAQSFNTMAQGQFEQGGGAVVAGVGIMLFGHSLNFMMGILSVVVHGVRLNMLEYSSHIGLEWTGFNYKPFGNKA